MRILYFKECHSPAARSNSRVLDDSVGFRSLFVVFSGPFAFSAIEYDTLDTLASILSSSLSPSFTSPTYLYSVVKLID